MAFYHWRRKHMGHAIKSDHVAHHCNSLLRYQNPVRNGFRLSEPELAVLCGVGRSTAAAHYSTGRKPVSPSSLDQQQGQREEHYSWGQHRSVLAEGSAQKDLLWELQKRPAVRALVSRS